MAYEAFGSSGLGYFHIGYDKEKKNMEQRDNISTWTSKRITISVISVLLAGINITLVVNMSRVFYEMTLWPAGVGILRHPEVIMVIRGIIWLAGALLFYRLIRSLLCQTDKRLIRHALIWGALLSASYVMGARLGTDETIFGGTERVLKSLGAFLSLTIAAASCIAPVLKGKRNETKPASPSPRNRSYSRAVCLSVFTAVIFICWLPVFLAYYPSVFAYDAEAQFYQWLSGNYSTHHPLVHTLFLRIFFCLGGALGSYSAGMAVHSVVQMLLMAGVFAIALTWLYEKGIPRWQCMLLLAFYALFPANSVLALSTTKDVLFSALVLLYTIMLYHMICDRKMRIGKRNGCILVIVSALMLLFRNNAVYAFVVSIPFVYAGCRKCHDLQEAGRKTKGARGYLILSAAALFFFVIAGTGLKTVTNAYAGSPREMLSVPLQQMARTRVMKEQQIDSDLRQELDAYIPSEWVFAAYDPHLADPVKNSAVIHGDSMGLIKTWIKLGLRYPDVYIDAFLDNSIGYWYLEDISHAQIYGIGSESGFGYLSTETRDLPAGCEIVPHSYLPGLRTMMEKVVSDNEYQRIPVLRIMFAPAFYWWMLCLYMAAAVYRRKYMMLLPVCFLAAYYATLLLSPTVLIRYIYPFVVTVPVLICCLLKDIPRNEGENIQ